jgi:Ser/Thr protein kinase RdoA (MazF antagonist)
MLGFYHGAVRGFDHRALHRATERYGSAALSRIVKGLLEGWLPYMMSRLETLVQALEEQVQDLETRYMQFGELPRLVIHGDYHGANLVFQGDHLVGVVDYDLAHWSARAMEVAEAIIAFCTEPGLGLKHIVYPGALDLDVASRFMTAYLHQVPLTEMEIRALPDMIRTIWLCAALDPPLEPPLSREAAPKALPEILALANWAVGHGADLVEACLAAGQSWAEGRHPLSN